jgi:cyclopropane fatty-acyl-phospholipid synthase-like methyltransferase
MSKESDALRNRLSDIFRIKNIRSGIILAVTIGGAIAFSIFSPVDAWMKAVLALLVVVIGLQHQWTDQIANKIDKWDPRSTPVAQLIKEQGETFEMSARAALSDMQSRLTKTIETMPDFFALAMDPRFQQYLSSIGKLVHGAPEQAVGPLHTIVAISLEDTASDIESIARSKLVIKSEPEIADSRWRAVVGPSKVGEFAMASSWVLAEWWRLNPLWRQQNEMALNKGLRLARIFIVENNQELEENKWVMREQAKQGLQVNWVYADTLRKNGIEPRDMLVGGLFILGFDNPNNSHKELRSGTIFGEQILETGMGDNEKLGFRLHAKRVEMSAYPPEVRKACAVMEQIYKLSQRFDDSEWWSYFFDDDYIPITRFKEATVKHEVDTLISKTKLKPGMRILDLGCAYGRMEHIMKEKIRSIEVVPIEYSEKLLNKAMSSVPNIFPRRGAIPSDMRYIDKNFGEEFDVVMSIFTSWGYFREADNQLMFKKVFSVIKPGGYFYLDIDNPAFIRGNTDLIQYTSDGYAIHRWDAVKQCDDVDSDGKKVKVNRRLSQFTVVSDNGSIKSKPLVSLRLYELGELQAVAHTQGFIFSVGLDEDGRQWSDTPNLHPERLVVILQKPV